MRSPATFALAVGLFLAPIGSLSAQVRTLQTQDLTLIYLGTADEYLAPYAARSFENSLQFHRRFLGYEPWDRVTVFLADFSDYGNAGAASAPRNLITAQIAPQSFAYETYPSNERIHTMMNHELVHLVAMDRTGRSDRFFRRLFHGKVYESPDDPETILYTYLTTPRLDAPRWYHEGVAVFVETWMAGGLGRAQGSYDEMVFRSMVRSGVSFYDPLGLVSEGTKVDFQHGVNSYLYGTRFVSYLAYQYSPESLLRWIGRSDESKAYYSSQFASIFGKTLDDAWADWVQWEHGFQQANLEKIRMFPTTPYEDRSNKALGSVSRAFFDPDAGKLYVGCEHPGSLASVVAVSMKDGSIETLKEIKGPILYSVTSLAWDPQARTLFYTTDNYAYRDLYSLDPSTGVSRMLLKDVRVGEIVFDPADRSIWGVRHFNGIATLVRIPYPYEEWYQIQSWPYGTVMYDLDISPDGRLLSASMGEIDGHHDLRIFEIESLLEGGTEPTARHDFGTTIPSNFVFSPDGRYLFGSSYYTGASNIFRYEIGTGDLQAVSNAETGMFRPVPLSNDSLIVFRYTGAGFIPSKIEARPIEDVSAITFLGERLAAEHPVVKDWRIGSSAAIPLESMVTYQGDYRSFRSMDLESIYPIVEGYKDSWALGLRANFADPAQINRTTFTTSYSPDNALASDERLHMSLRFQRKGWTVDSKLNDADFYDLFGPTKTSRKGYSLGTGYRKTLVYDEPRNLEVGVNSTFYGNLEKLPDYQNVTATYDKLFQTTVRLSYRTMRASIGAVDYEKGIKAETIVTDNYVNGRSVPGIVGNFDAGFPLPLHNSSIWSRSSIGAAFGDLNDPFANYFFGAFGNNWVDHGSIRRYQEYYSFPGVNLNSVGGRNFVKSMLEWNLPPLRFKNVGTPGCYATWARASLFTSGIDTNLDVPSAERKLANLGAQVDVRFTVLSRLSMTLSFGGAIAVEKDTDRKEEFMASLKILN